MVGQYARGTSRSAVGGTQPGAVQSALSGRAGVRGDEAWLPVPAGTLPRPGPQSDPAVGHVHGDQSAPRTDSERGVTRPLEESGLNRVAPANRSSKNTRCLPRSRTRLSQPHLNRPSNRNYAKVSEGRGSHSDFGSDVPLVGQHAHVYVTLFGVAK